MSEASQAEFRRMCELHGLSVTHQRYVIYSALMRMHGHPSPEAVYEAVRQDIPSISLATVYKNIKTFVDSGMLREVSLHHGSARIETNMEPHHHMVCSNCKAIVDLDESEFEAPRLKKRAPGGFQVHRISIEVIGLCKNCARS